MFSRRRSDTLVETIEQQYNVDFHCRRGTLLGNLLADRGFDSQSQLLDAYFGRLTSHARKRKTFLTFHYEDRSQVSGFRLMLHNPGVALDLYDLGLTEAVQSDRKPYIRQAIKEKISRSEVVICLIGNGTAWRDWVDWELQTGLDLRKGLCGVRLKDSRGRTPPLLKDVGAPIAAWNMQEIVSAIERAAARRS